MGRSHHLYEQVRSPKLPQAERVALYLELKGVWDGVPLNPCARVPTNMRAHAADFLNSIVWQVFYRECIACIAPS